MLFEQGGSYPTLRRYGNQASKEAGGRLWRGTHWDLPATRGLPRAAGAARGAGRSLSVAVEGKADPKKYLPVATPSTAESLQPIERAVLREPGTFRSPSPGLPGVKTHHVTRAKRAVNAERRL